MSHPSVSIIIPVHNEAEVLEENINQICHRLASHEEVNWELLIVENGSTDQTLAIARKLSDERDRVRVESMGRANYGMALQHGFLAVQGDIIVNFDVDYWDTDFVGLVAHVMQYKYDIVIASKSLLLSQDRRGFIRKAATYIFRMMLFFLFALRVSDTHGIKAWRNSARLQHHFREAEPTHHTYDTEVIIRAMRDGCEVLEVPINVEETRASSRSLLRRIPEALGEITRMYRRIGRS